MKLLQKVEYWASSVPVVVITTVVVAIWAMCEIGPAWRIFEFCAVVAVYSLVLVWHFWPVKPFLVFLDSGCTAQPGAVSCNPGKDGCREYKHQRQMEAFSALEAGVMV